MRVFAETARRQSRAGLFRPHIERGSNLRRRDNFGAPLERRRDRFGHWANTGTLLPTQSAGARPHQHSIGWRHGTRGALINSFDSLAARRARSSPRGKLVDRLRSTLCAARTLRGCAVGQHGAHCSPRYRTGLDRTNTATGRRCGLAKFVVTSFETGVARDPCAFHAREYRPIAHAVRAPHCAGLLGVVALWPNAGRAPPHVIGRGSTSPTPRQVGGTCFERLWPPRLSLVARGPLAVHAGDCWPIAHGARAPRSAD